MNDDMDDIPSSLGDEDASERDGDDSESRANAADADGDGEGAEADFDTTTRDGALSKAQLAELPPEGQLSKWSETFLPIEVDLVTELDAGNLFFIHAESLIFDQIASKVVPFEGDTQFLRLTFAIEHLLSRIKAAGGVFRLVFFEASRKLFTAAFEQSVWAFRQAFLVHCKASGIDHVVFPHWYAQEWKEHVAEWRPSFFLLANDVVELNADEPEDDEEDDDKPKLRGFFHALLLKCLSAKTHVALLNGLQFRGHRIMAFTLEPDLYNAFIDFNVQTSLLALFSEEDEEEEDDEGGTEEPVLAGLKAFKDRAGDKVDGVSLLRSFIAVRFGKSTLRRCAGENSHTCTLMHLVVKTLLLQEILIRQIPLSKRAFSTCPPTEWDLFANSISAALERYFSTVAKVLGELTQEKNLCGLDMFSSDLFDGRLYRHIFHYLVDRGLAKKGKVEQKLLGFADWVDAELEFLWAECNVDTKDPFYPISTQSLGDIPGIQPPALPPKVENRPSPQLADVKTDFLEQLLQASEIKHVELLAGCDEDRVDVVFQPTAEEGGSGCGWTPGIYLDAVQELEFMEMNRAEKSLLEKFRAKGKVTDRDLEFLRKFREKRKSLALRALHLRAKSLTGSDKLHPAIIMKEEDKKGEKKVDKKAANKEKDESKEKLSKKHQELLEKRMAEEEKAVREADKRLMESWDKPLDKLAEIMDMDKLEKDWLDLLLGYNRIIHDSFVGFPAVASAFKTTEAQAKIVIKAIKNVRTALKKIQLNRLPDADKPKATRLVRYLFTMCQEAMNSYGSKDIDGKGIKAIQEALISVGFPSTAETAFQAWKTKQRAAAQPAEGAAEDADKDKGGKGGGKDDKKKPAGKDDKKKDDKTKEDKKDKKEKKDKKGDKDDDEGDKDLEKELESHHVKKEVETLWSGVGEDEFAWQLCHLGPYMTRTVGSSKDEKLRVNFKPDKWQKDLLDIVDDKRSALVVAPTASGKTFIGYYVMDKVLRADNDGVAVYVAPSKHLVNQASAEIYARFSSKTYPPQSNNELLGVFINEFNSAGGFMEEGKWENCQVLVTLPQILEMLLLSPNKQSWVQRLRWVVFDEVHCIGGEDGLLWEHTMQMIPCPFIALSATVAEPEHFHGWLNEICESKGHAPVELVRHTERWNDLYKFLYTKGELKPMHPFCCLVEKSVRLQGLSGDLMLTPREMYQLWYALSQLIGSNSTWDNLSPKKYFCDRDGFLTKRDTREYEVALKETFAELLKDGTIDSQCFSQMQLALQRPAQEQGTFDPPSRKGVPDTEEFSKMGKSMGYMQAGNLFKLCKDLDKMQSLPAIIFNFSRSEIAKMLEHLIQELKDRQYDKYYGTEAAKLATRKIMDQRMAEYERKHTAWEQACKAKASKNQESKASRKTAEEGDRSAVKDEALNVSDDVGDEPQEPTDIAEDIDLEFSFHSPKALGQWSEEIAEVLDDLQISRVNKHLIDKNLIEGLKRGIGMHHEGCPRSYRDAVELFFRRGYLKVVFATGTLALGINMPCRSTIFCGDFLDLNGLMFRQMAGRAGRRGFDLEGKVVFFDMAFLKVRSLVASDLTTLTGQFMLSPTTLLRALHMWERVSRDAQQGKQLARPRAEIVRCIVPVFSRPFFRSETAKLRTQVVYQTRFHVDLLYKEGFVDAESGSTRGLANFVTHLCDVEPANLLLARLLSKGLLHQYLRREMAKEKKGDRRSDLTVRLTALLSWFLYPKRLPRTLPKERVRRKKHMPSADCPVLPPLPKDIAEEVVRFNQLVVGHVQDLAWTVASTSKDMAGDHVLPLSKQSFPIDWGPRGNPFAEERADIAKWIIKQLTRYRARSPFSAIGGNGDYFDSVADIVSSVRNILHLDLNCFPVNAHPVHGDSGLEPTNSWMLDFMIHRKIKYLWEDNGIGPTQAWRLIAAFREAVKKATAIVRAYAGRMKDDLVLKTFEALYEDIRETLNVAEKHG